jgi:hypothetical protein
MEYRDGPHRHSSMIVNINHDNLIRTCADYPFPRLAPHATVIGFRAQTEVFSPRKPRLVTLRRKSNQSIIPSFPALRGQR